MLSTCSLIPLNFGVFFFCCYFLDDSGYLSCCRFLSDTEIITGSGDCTWWAPCSSALQHCLQQIGSKQIILWHPYVSNHFAILYSPILRIFHFSLAVSGTSRLEHRRRFFLATLVTACQWLCLQILIVLFQEHVTTQPNCGTYERAGANRPSMVMRVT